MPWVFVPEPEPAPPPTETLTHRRFDAALCCAHEWRGSTCARCGAYCEREDGRIVYFDAYGETS